MPAPIIGAAALAAARVLAAQIAKQTGKELTKNQMKAVAIKVASRPKKKVNWVQARRIAEQAAGPKARSMGGEAPLRATRPKPDVRITTKAGKYRGYGTLSKEKTTVTRPVKRSTNKGGSAITVRQGTPRKPADVRERMQRERRDRLRESLTIRVNPARPKKTPKQVKQNSSATDARREEIIQRYYNIRFGDRSAPSARSSQPEPRSIEQRIARGVEEKPRSSRKSSFDKEAEARIGLADRVASGSKKAMAESRVKPGKRTKVATAIKTGKPSDIKGATRNMRKVLRDREIKEIAAKAAGRTRKAK